MKYQKFLPLAILVLLASTLTAQQPSPTPPDDQVVRISTDLIQIDVTVTDKNGKVVTDLRPEDFELFENGQKQNVSGFSFISRTAGSATLTDNASASKAPPLNSPQQLKQESVRNTIAKADGAPPKLEAQARIFQNNSVIVEGAVNKLDVSAQPDPKHIRVSGAMMLKDSLAAGDYVLQLTVFDRASRQTATQLLPFEIVK